MDFHIELRNGKLLKGIIISPGDDTRIVIILVHGLGEHIQRYKQWAELFKQEKIATAGLDLPGHGRSEGSRGYIKSYSLVGEMIDILLKTANRTFPGLPVYLYGHSLGGGIVLEYILKKNPKISGAIITSPWIRLSFEPSKIKLMLASIVKHLFPGLIQPSGLNILHISHDPEVVERYKNDPLIHSKISVSLFDSAMKAAAYSLQHASDLKIPTLLIHGNDDLICSPEGTREFANKTPLAELKIWEGGYHELHNEPFRHEVFRYILSWMNGIATGRRQKVGVS